MPRTINVSVESADATDTDLGGNLLGSSTLKNVTGATNANPCVVTVVGHGRKVGDWIYLSNLGGITQLNGIYWKITGTPTADTIEINTDSTAYGTYTSGGYMYPYATSKTATCYVRKANHGYAVGQQVYITGVTGMVELNDQYWTVTSVEGDDTFGINVDSTTFATYTGTNSGYVKAFFKHVENITQANPAVVTASNHTFTNGQRIRLKNIGGMTQLEDKTFTVANAATNTFELSGVDSTGYSAFTSGGEIHWFRKTIAKSISDSFDGDTLRIDKTAAATTVAGAVTFTWNRNLNTVTTSATTVGTIAVGDFVGPSTAAGNGHNVPYYKVIGVNSTTITLESKAYLGSGVNQIIEAGIKKVVPVLTGVSANYIGAINKSLTVSGGWTFADQAVPVRDSETWLSHAYTQTGSTNLGIAQSNVSSDVSYLNIVDCYYCWMFYATGAVAHHVSVVSGYVYNVHHTASDCVISDFMSNGNGGSSWSSWSLTAPVSFGANVYCISYYFGTSSAFTTTKDLSGGYARSSGWAYVTSTANVSFSNVNANYCVDGVHAQSGAHGMVVKNSTIANVTNGIYYGTLITNAAFESNNISNCTSYGIYMQQSTGIIIRQNTFTSCAVDISGDGYSSDIYCYSNVHNSPSNYAYSRQISTGTIYIMGDTIDVASRYKTLQVVTNTGNYVLPQYRLVNAFDITGAIYYNVAVIRKAGAAPFLEVSFSSLLATNQSPVRVFSTFNKAGVGKTITYEINANSTISPLTLTPRVYLNGVLIQSETPITTVSTGNTWDQKVITVSAGALTEDGEVSIDWLLTQGTGTINLRVIDVVDT